MAQAWAEESGRLDPDVRIVVSGGGTGAGFKQSGRGEIEVADASRPIRASERAECAAAGIEPSEVHVAIDALAFVVSAQNSIATE